MKRLFWACAGLSLGLHAALAIGWQPRTAPAATALNNRPPSPLHSRLIVPPSRGPSPATQAVAALAARHQPPSLQAPVGTAAGTNPRQVDPPPAAIEPAGHETEILANAAAAAEAEAEAETETTATADGWDHYLWRSQLTVAPSPREHILLGYPDNGPAIGRFVLTLTLYIDEAGAVRRVDVAGDATLPDALRQAARSAFADKRFSPGEREGELVKSRIRIEAVYESLALPTFAATATAARGANAH